MKWTPDKVIALILVVGCLLLMGFHIDGEVKSILLMAAGWTFGTSYQERKSTHSHDEKNNSTRML